MLTITSNLPMLQRKCHFVGVRMQDTIRTLFVVTLFFI